MALNRRIFYATHAVGLAPNSSAVYTPIHGAQSAGLSTNYTLQNIQELGQINLYQLIELIPEIEVTLEKVLDGYPLMYHLATQGTIDGSLVGRSAQQAMCAVSVYTDTQSSASGVPTSSIECSGMFWGTSSFTFPVDRPFTESLTLVGNTRINKNVSPTFLPNFTNTDAPLSLAGSGGTQLRQHMIFFPVLTASGSTAYTLERSQTLDVNGQVNAFLTILPPDVVGISTSGTNDVFANTGDFGCHIQNITVTVNAGRDAVYELGKKFPYFRFMQFPLSVTTEITTIAGNLDTLQATEAGLDGQGNNVLNRTIKLRCLEGTWIDLGTQNKCQSVSFGGGNADGGNDNLTYSYITYNTYLVSHPQDPSNGQGSVRWPY